ncbi:hypothetical protein H257_14581 [Aphanomyces astaci]|uniref:Rab-GAP TBC domain-containing protein n=3 Tax=Aphanomyces astaci TaxID=112090 RepID=W4FSW0_APHAT|nr:hypothetical protein H257_14581 [Aphanomyces astaci]ETV69733.1 hypothetical protein H257_14581 [Aphanomyces astaci]|eukprot:XP_009840747.1 hypothetical protein H257_14581 [Aphanomyces astaci]
MHPSSPHAAATQTPPAECVQRRSGAFDCRRRRAEDVLLVVVEHGWVQPHTVLFVVVTKHPRLIKRFRGGIPNSLRRAWWVSMATSTHAGDMMSLLNHHTPSILPFLGTTGLDGIILRDLDRTFPSEPLFATGQGPALLANVLKAVSVHVPDVGYCQGMNFIAAKLLLLWTCPSINDTPPSSSKSSSSVDQDAFHVLSFVVRRHAALWSPGMAGLRKCIYALHKLISVHLPRLHGHLHRIGMHPGYFATQWLATLFARALPLPTFAHVWDRFLVDGMKMLLRVALLLLSWMEPSLLHASDMHEASMLLSRPPKLAPSSSNGGCVRSAMSFKVTRSTLIQLEDQRQSELVARWISTHPLTMASRRMKHDDDDDDDAVFYPEVDNPWITNKPSLDMDQLCRDVVGLDAAVASDVAVFRRKIEQVHRAADAAVVAYMCAAAMFTEASYDLEEMVDLSLENEQDIDDEDGLPRLPWYRRVFACVDSTIMGARDRSGRSFRHVQLDESNELHQSRWRRTRGMAEYARRRRQLMEAQVDMDELHAFKTKVTEQFLTVLDKSEREKTAVLRRHLGDDTSMM